jgi:hypothetical protein
MIITHRQSPVAIPQRGSSLETCEGVVSSSYQMMKHRDGAIDSVALDHSPRPEVNLADV